MSKYVERFSTSERVLHWFVTATFFTLVLSGIGLFSRLFNGYFNLFGGGTSAILFHKIAACFFFVSSVMLFLSHKKDVTTFDDDDQEWIKKRGGYLSREKVHFNIGKFNPGQKIFGIFIGVATLVLGITGLFIWWPTAFPRFIVQFSLMMHGLFFVLSIMFVIVHVYLATVGNPGTLDGMLYGHVKRLWAKKHSPKWYREIAREQGE